MKFVNRTVLAALCAAFVVAPAASAAGLTDCIKMNKQVTEALGAAQASPSTDVARAHAKAGQSYCLSGLYAQGIARYSKALQLLGKA